MLNAFHTTLCFIMIAVVVVSTTASGVEDTQADKFCEKFPTLHMCRLRDELTGSLVELQYLLQDGDATAATAAAQQHSFGGAINAQDVQKRKSAFVRFGKRSIGGEVDEQTEMQKRKSAFVRFGRSFFMDPQYTEKRKSQYIRFGK